MWIEEEGAGEPSSCSLAAWCTVSASVTPESCTDWCPQRA